MEICPAVNFKESTLTHSVFTICKIGMMPMCVCVCVVAKQQVATCAAVQWWKRDMNGHLVLIGTV